MKELLLILLLLVVIFFALRAVQGAPVRATAVRRAAQPQQRADDTRGPDQNTPKLEGFQIDQSSLPELPRRRNRKNTTVSFNTDTQVRVYAKGTGEVLGDYAGKISA
jgi:hypothetical protein